MLTNRVLNSVALILLSALPLYSGQINFIYPAEGASLPSVPKTFIFGNISPSTAVFTLNGEKIAVHTNGGFLTYLPIRPGDFSLNGALDDGTTAQRVLKVRQAADVVPSTGELKLEFTSHLSDSENLPGDYLKITAVGTPSRKAVCSLEGVFKDLSMPEVPAGSGRYSASYLVKGSDQTEEGKLTAHFKGGLFAHGASAKAKGKVKIIKRSVLVETSTDTALRNAVDGGYMMFLPKGVKLVSNGRANGMRRVMLSNDEIAWVDDSKVQFSPGFPFGYGSETGAIRFKKTDFGSSATVTLYDKLPYTAEMFPWGLRLTLYYANLHTNTIVYDSADMLVKNVAFRQAAYGKVEIDFETAPGALWGYNVSYPNNAKALQLDLRARPEVPLSWPRPLSGLTVVLDPGHSPKYTTPFDGAIGPMASYEFQVNMAIARKTNEKLSALGALVQMTRTGDETVGLSDRPKLAKELGGDLFLSIHNNALPDGEDPFSQPRGFSIYSYQRQSRPLAAAIHRAYLKNIQLPDEGLRYGDYLVARMTWMPAVLIENAYMMFPRQEEQLNSPDFQEELADSIAEGVLDFFNIPERAAPARKAKQ